MSTYNESEQMLKQSIESILNQNYKVFEFIIILDNPENKLIRAIVENYRDMDDRIFIVYHKCNMGLTYSLNEGIRIAKGELIARMDADDIASEHRLQIEYEAIVVGKLDLVAASKENIDENGNSLGMFINDFTPERLRRLLPFDNSINHPSVLMKKSVVQELGGYRDIAGGEDYDLWIRMLLNDCKMAILSDRLIYYRVRSDSITRMDKYKQYVSECFVKKMYRDCQGSADKKSLSMEDYYNFCEQNKLSEEDICKFNEAYACLYKGFENMKKGGKIAAFTKIIQAIKKDRKMLVMVVERMKYHVRKKVVCRWLAKEND